LDKVEKSRSLFNSHFLNRLKEMNKLYRVFFLVFKINSNRILNISLIVEFVENAKKI